MHQLLIVDDQIDLADDLALMLPWHEAGIDGVFKAYSAQEALEIMNTEPIDVVITDIRMPGMSGLEFTSRLRASLSNVKIILLSGYSDFEYARTALSHQVSEYLLKPASDEELLFAVGRAVKEIKERWQEVSSTQKALQSLEDNLPILRRTLLTDLLQHRRLAEDALADKLEVLKLPFTASRPVYLMLVRLEDYFARLDQRDFSLMEYAVTNMAEEVFSGDFHLWYVKDVHDYWVFLIQPADNLAIDQGGQGTQDVNEAQRSGDRHILSQIERKTAMLQHYVKLYLKGTISAIISASGTFPDDVGDMYDSLVVQLLQRIGSERELLITAIDEAERGKAGHLKELYEPPQLMHLLEAGQWDSLQRKLDAIFAKLEGDWHESHEHILEVYFAIISAFSYAVHKKKQWLADLIGDEFDKLSGGATFHTVAQLRDWTMRIVQSYRASAENDQRDSRHDLIHKVQAYVADHLPEATLQTIASHVYLNPSYLSKIYKSETGEGISEFIFRMRMERACHLLQSSNLKVYEVAQQLGYQKTSYFIKLFRDKYGCTPQEYKDMAGKH